MAQIGGGPKSGRKHGGIRPVGESGLELESAGNCPTSALSAAGRGAAARKLPAEGLLGEGQDRCGHAGPRHGADLLWELGDEPAVGEACRFRPGVAAGGASGAAAVDAVEAQAARAAQVRDLQLPGCPEFELWTPAAHAGVRTNSPRLMRADQ